MVKQGTVQSQNPTPHPTKSTAGRNPGIRLEEPHESFMIDASTRSREMRDRDEMK